MDGNAFATRGDAMLRTGVPLKTAACWRGGKDVAAILRWYEARLTGDEQQAVASRVLLILYIGFAGTKRARAVPNAAGPVGWSPVALSIRYSSATMGSTERRVLGGRYELVRHLGSGTMSSVYVATDRLLDRRVALKLLNPDVSADPAFVARMRVEARAAASVNHPNLVAIYDIGGQDDAVFIVAEYVAGHTLADLLRSDPLSIHAAVDVAVGVTSALGELHRVGIVPREVNPSGIFVTDSGSAKLAYYGSPPVTDPVDARYLSPEQAQGKPVERRSNLYSVGVVMYEMATGQPPYDGANPISIAFKHTSETQQPLRELRPDVPDSYTRIVEKLLRKEPGERFTDTAELLHALSGSRAARPDHRLAAGNPVQTVAPGPGDTVSTRRRRPRGELSGGGHGDGSSRPFIFLSYSHHDFEAMLLLKAALDKAHLDVWTDTDLVPGTPSWTKAIETAIEAANALVVVLTPNAKRSEWVEREVSYGQLQSIPIYPVLAAGTAESAIPFILIQHQYVDVTRSTEVALSRFAAQLSTSFAR